MPVCMLIIELSIKHISVCPVLNMLIRKCVWCFWRSPQNLRAITPSNTTLPSTESQLTYLGQYRLSALFYVLITHTSTTGWMSAEASIKSSLRGSVYCGVSVRIISIVSKLNPGFWIPYPVFKFTGSIDRSAPLYFMLSFCQCLRKSVCYKV